MWSPSRLRGSLALGGADDMGASDQFTSETYDVFARIAAPGKAWTDGCARPPACAAGPRRSAPRRSPAGPHRRSADLMGPPRNTTRAEGVGPHARRSRRWLGARPSRRECTYPLRIASRMFRRERPTARGSPIPRVRSKTDRAGVRMMPKIAMITAVASRTPRLHPERAASALRSALAALDHVPPGLAPVASRSRAIHSAMRGSLRSRLSAYGA